MIHYTTTGNRFTNMLFGATVQMQWFAAMFIALTVFIAETTYHLDNPDMVAFLVIMICIMCYALAGLLYIRGEHLSKEYKLHRDNVESWLGKRPVYNAMDAAELVQLPTGQYVYLMQDVSLTGFIKIGRSNNVARRLHQFDLALPIQLKVIHVIRCNDMCESEAELHRYYAKKRINGEFFDLTVDDVLHLKSIKEMTD